MYVYINPFWLGVFSTIIAEVFILIIVAIRAIASERKYKMYEKENEDEEWRK